MKRAGFTLVELLIVIVVIAILAVISVVAYRGISERAYSSSMSAAIDGYNKHLFILGYEDGSYIDDPNVTFIGACLGQLEDYPATDIFPAGYCKYYDNQPLDYPYQKKFDQQLADRLQESATTLPKVPANFETHDGSMHMRGAALFLYRTSYEIEIAVPPGMPCPSNTTKYDYYGDYYWCEAFVDLKEGRTY